MFRRFVLASFAISLVAAVALGAMLQRIAADQLISAVERSNVGLTVLFANAMWPEFGRFVDRVGDLNGDALRARPETQVLKESVHAKMRGLGIAKVKIYALNGKTVFSTEDRQIGEDKSGNGGFLKARDGTVVSELTHRNQFSAFEAMIFDRDLLSSYVPMRDGNGEIVAVFEVYDDVTQLFAAARAGAWSVFGSIAFVFSVLYVVLIFVVHRVDRGRNRAERSLRALLSDLEGRIIARTIEISAATEELKNFRAAMNMSGDSIYLTDRATMRFIYANETACRRSGYPRQQLLAMGPQDLLSMDRQSIEESFDKIIANGPNGVATEVVATLGGGRRIIAELQRSALRRHDGWTIVTISRDITARKQMEAALDRAKERLDIALSAASISLWDWDVPTDRLVFDERFSMMLGKPARVTETSMQDLAPLRHPDDSEQLRQMRAIVLSGETDHYKLEQRFRADSGEWIWIQSVGKVVERDVAGNVVRMIGTVIDISEHKRIQEALERAERTANETSLAKSQFLANMSHEIRTPLNGVIGMTDLLLDTTLDEEQRRFVMMAHRSGEALLGIINDILDLSKIEAGRLELESIPFDLWEVAEDVGELLAERAHGKGLELLCQIDEDVPINAIGDPGRLRQILTNLAANAIKFTDAGEVSIVVQRVGEACTHADGACPIRFSVIDSGIGMSAEQQQRLFLPFSQADSSTTRKYGGTGLGLAISRQLVDAMGGTIELESAPGKGSIFRFTIPVVPTVSNERWPTSAAASNLAHRRVLVVDDHGTNRNIVKRQLESLGLSVETASDGAQALASLRAGGKAQAVEVAFIDMKMPGMNGIELAHAIRNDRTIVEPALVMLTSVMPADGAKAAREAGIVAYLNKPARRSQLEKILHRLLDAPAAVLAVAADVAAPIETNKPGRVLLAEDNMVNRTIATSMLRQLGWEVDCAKNGVEAVSAVANHRYDVVLMDCQMPEMDGFAATAAIRQTEQESGCATHVRIVALTANAVQGDRERCLAAGMDDYLAKPFRKEQLARVLVTPEATIAAVTHA